jgi:inosine-uridine nucleoside N-ribohydrolase
MKRKVLAGSRIVQAAPDPARRHQPGDLDAGRCARLGASGSAEGTWARDLLEWTLSAWSANEVYIWDLVAAVAATDPALCPEVPLAVEVVVASGTEQGRTAVVKGGTLDVGVCLQPKAAQIKARAAGVFGR